MYTPSAQAPTQDSNRHETFLAHDMAIIEKMEALTARLTTRASPDADEIMSLLRQLGTLSLEIKHNENDPACIRNKFGVFSDNKKQSREERFNPTGIPFQGLFFISQWLSQQNENTGKQFIAEFITANHSEFVALHEKISALPGEMSNNTQLTNLQQLSEYANDVLHLEIMIKALATFPINEIDLEEATSRYAIARVFSIVGEGAKSLSVGFKDKEEIKRFCSEMGKLRDLMKLPNIMPKTAEKMTAAKTFLDTAQTTLHQLFSALRGKMERNFTQNPLGFTEKYRDWLKGELNVIVPALGVPGLLESLQQVQKRYKALKSAKAANATNTGGDPVAPTQTSEDLFNTARELIVKYQQTHKNFKMITAKFHGKFGTAPLDSTHRDYQYWLKRKAEIETKVPASLQKTLGLYETLCNEHPEVLNTFPSPQPQRLLDFVLSEPKPKEPAKPKKWAPIQRYSQAIEKIYQQLETLNPKESVLQALAHDQCIAFLGQLFREVSTLNQSVFEEPLPTTWTEDVSQTIGVRHGQLMHNITRYDQSLIQAFSKNAVLPWRKQFQDFHLLAMLMEDATESEASEGTQQNDDILLEKIQVQSEEQREDNASYYNTIGMLLADLQQFEPAEQCFLLALKFSKGFKNDTPACIMHNLADIYRAQDNHERTTLWIKRCWSHRQKFSTETDPYYISTCIHLGMCYDQLYQHQEALVQYELALKICQRHNLDQYQALHQLAINYETRQDCPTAKIYYDQLLLKTLNLRTRLYLLDDLEGFALQSGDTSLALQYYKEKKKLFSGNIPHFKEALGDKFSHFNDKMIGPVFIYEVMGEYQKLATLLKGKRLHTATYVTLKLIVLRGLEQYDEAQSLARRLLTSTSQKKYKFEPADVITIKCIAASIALHTGKTAYAIETLKVLCAEAMQWHKANKGFHSTTLLSPFNAYCSYLITTEDFQTASDYSLQAMKLIKHAHFTGLSKELFILLENFLEIQTALNNIEIIYREFSPFEALFFEHFNSPRPPASYYSLSKFVINLVSYNRKIIANAYLTLLDRAIEQQGLLDFENWMFLKKRAILSHAALEHTERVIALAQTILTNTEFSPYTPAVSFFLANLLFQERRKIQLFSVVETYHSLWNNNLALAETPLFQTYRQISNLHWQCMVHIADQGQFDPAIMHASHCIKLARRIYSLLCEEAPHKKTYIDEVLIQYYRLTLAILEFYNIQTKDETHAAGYTFTTLLNKPSLNHDFSITEAQTLNKIYFAGELQITTIAGAADTVSVAVPQNWKSFLAAFRQALPGILQKKTSLVLLNMDSKQMAPYIRQFYKASLQSITSKHSPAFFQPEKTQTTSEGKSSAPKNTPVSVLRESASINSI